jgi:hypothetical protein
LQVLSLEDFCKREAGATPACVRPPAPQASIVVTAPLGRDSACPELLESEPTKTNETSATPQRAALPAATPKKWPKISAVSIFLFASGFGLARLFLEKKDKKSVTIALPFR